MKIELVDIETLKPDPDNVRRHDDKNLGAIKHSLTTFGQQKPIVVGKGGRVIAGNATLEAARGLGWKKIAIVRTRLAGKQATAYAIADNRTTDLSIFDNAALAAQLEELAAGNGFDLESTGFNQIDFAELLASLENGEKMSPETARTTLAQRFVVPPFSVLDARQGYWQERKRAWIALGIRGELGRGGAVNERQRSHESSTLGAIPPNSDVLLNKRRGPYKQ